jgi:zinc protease
MIRIRTALPVAVLALVPNTAVFAQVTADRPAEVHAAGDPLPVDPAVRVGRLENGLRYYIRANTRPEQRAELMLAVNAGSVLEGEDQRGLAHFLEHMAFNGTRSFPKQELVGYLESIGMRFGADLNAYTSFDETVYTLTVPTDTGKALERGIQILEEWAGAQTLDRAEIDKERGVVIEEWRLGQGADARMRDRMFPVLFSGSRYAERLPIGTTEVLSSFRPEALERFYRDWYRPELMAVIAVGDFDAAQVEVLIRERFGGIAASPGGPPRPRFELPVHEEPLVSIVTDREATSSVVQVFFKRPGQPMRTVADYRLSLVESLYDRMLNMRLSELAQQPDPPFLGAGGSSGTLVRSAEAYVLGAGVPDGGIERGLEAVLTEAERVARHGFSATELERAKADLLRGYEVAYAERDKSNSATYASEYVRAFLEDEPIPGIAYEFELAQQAIPRVAVEEVNGLARESMRGSMVIAVQAPEKDGVEVPTEAELLALFDAVRAKEIAPYRDLVAETPLVASRPDPGRVTGETRHDAVGVIEWSLSNGARVLVKPTQFKNDEILFRAFSPGGASLAPDSAILSAMLATTAVTSGGLGELTLVQLNKELAGKAVRVTPYISEMDEGMTGQTAPRDLETLLQLTYLYFTAPRMDADAFQSLRTRIQASIANRSADPRTAFIDTLQLTLAQHHPRAVPITAERIAGWQLAPSLDFYRDRFADASDFTFVFVGSLDVNELRPLVEQWLAALPAAGRTETGRDVGITPPEGVIDRVVRKGIEPKSETNIIFTGPFEYDRRNRHILSSLSAVLEMRLREVLREDLGGTYGVQLNQSTSRVPHERYSYSVSFGANPDRLEELTRAVFQEIEKLKTDLVDAETLAKVKETQRRSWESSQTQNAFWLSQIAFTAQSGENLETVPEYVGMIDALTPEEIRVAARRYLRADNYVRVSLYPENRN